MADRIIESAPGEVPEIPALLQSLMSYVLDEGKAKTESGEGVVPFTALAVKDTLFMEDASAETPEGCYALAQHTVEGARGADAYAFCYDGYIDLDDRQVDAVIAEGGLPGEETGYAAGFVYTTDKYGKVSFEKQPTYIGLAPNFMAGLKAAEEYSEDEINDKYQVEEDEAAVEAESAEPIEDAAEETEE